VAGADEDSEEEKPVVKKEVKEEVPLYQAAKPTEFKEETPKKKRTKSVKKERSAKKSAEKPTRKPGKSVEKKKVEATEAPVEAPKEVKEPTVNRENLSRKERKKLDYIQKV